MTYTHFVILMNEAKQAWRGNLHAKIFLKTLTCQYLRNLANTGLVMHKYLMKRLSTALSSKLSEGRPRKYCKRCGVELRPTNLCKPKGMPQEPSTMKQRISNTDKKERMEKSQ